MSSRFPAFQHREFLRYWIGLAISVSGQQLIWMLEPWLIYEISGSKAFLGVNALAQAVTATALALVGGGILLALVLGATDSPRIAAGAVLLVAIAAAATYALILAKVYLPPVKRARSGGMASDIAEGVRFVWRNRIFSILIGLAYYT